jgi:hypothetical protein
MKKCENGHKSYASYIKITDINGKRKWKKIGYYCLICKKHIPLDKVIKDKKKKGKKI